MKILDKLKIGDMVYFEFEDHCTDAPTWVQTNVLHHTVCMVKAVGIVAINTENYLTVVQLMQHDNQVCSQSFTVVKSCITKCSKLRIIK